MDDSQQNTTTHKPTQVPSDDGGPDPVLIGMFVAIIVLILAFAFMLWEAVRAYKKRAQFDHFWKNNIHRLSRSMSLRSNDGRGLQQRASILSWSRRSQASLDSTASIMYLRPASAYNNDPGGCSMQHPTTLTAVMECEEATPRSRPLSTFSNLSEDLPSHGDSIIFQLPPRTPARVFRDTDDGKPSAHGVKDCYPIDSYIYRARDMPSYIEIIPDQE